MGIPFDRNFDAPYERLVEVAPAGLNHVFISDSGATAVEAALKMAFQYRLVTQGKLGSGWLRPQGRYERGESCLAILADQAAGGTQPGSRYQKDQKLGETCSRQGRYQKAGSARTSRGPKTRAGGVQIQRQ